MAVGVLYGGAGSGGPQLGGREASAEEAWVPPHPVERRIPDARDLRPLNVPVAPARDSGQRLIERSKLNNERRRLEQRRDPHDFRSQNRLRRLDRGINRTR